MPRLEEKITELEEKVTGLEDDFLSAGVEGFEMATSQLAALNPGLITEGISLAKTVVDGKLVDVLTVEDILNDQEEMQQEPVTEQPAEHETSPEIEQEISLQTEKEIPLQTEQAADDAEPIIIEVSPEKNQPET